MDDRARPDRDPTGDAPTGVTQTDHGGARAPASAAPGSIGRYRILGKLGEGGMGTVYEAEQESPRRRVAVKVVRGGQFVDESRIRMFQREAETLARLRHPNIGGIYESGRTDDGQHFFAMEIVRGSTLDAYLDDRPSAADPYELRFRMQLFRKIADAVHYAHQRGVIHRDLKPSNVIVTDETASASLRTTSDLRPPEIKILDFGLARITEGDVAAATMTTEVGVIKGTLAYMSPEQARGSPGEIDVRTDVYALGVMLFEMLSGQRPYDVMRKSVAEAVRVICEESPRSLAASITGIRKIDPDVETIVGKALEKEVNRRYASAAALSEDIARWLAAQPILARPPTTSYQLRKFAQRNRVLVGGIAATIVVLVAGIVVSTMFGLREAAQRREAEQARTDLQAVVDFQAGMLADVDPEQMGRRLAEDLRDDVEKAARARDLPQTELASFLEAYDATMREVNLTNTALDIIDRDILDRAVVTLEERFEEKPLIGARLRATIGDTYRKLGRYEPAERQLEASLATRKRILGDEHPQTLDTMQGLAVLYHGQGRYEEAEPLYLETLAVRKRILGDEHPHTLACMNNLAAVYKQRGRHEEAESLYLETLALRKRVLGDEDPQTVDTMGNLALLYNSRGRYEEAEPLFLEALALRKRVLGDEDPRTLAAMNNLALLYRNQGRNDDAEPLYLESLATRRRVLGDEHPETLVSMNNLAILYNSQFRYEDAEPLFAETLALRTRVLGDQHPYTLASMINLAALYKNQGRLGDAEERYLEAVTIGRSGLGEDHPYTLAAMNNLALLYKDQERYADAEPLLVDTLALRKRVLGDQHPFTLSSMKNLADLRKDQRRYADAEPLYVETLALRERVLGDEHPDTLVSRGNLADLYKYQGRHVEAEPLYVKTLSQRRQVLGDEHPHTLAAMNGLALFLLTREPPDARDPERALRLALEVADATGYEDPDYLDTLSLAHHLTGDTARAIENQKRAVALLPEGDTPQRRE